MLSRFSVAITYPLLLLGLVLGVALLFGGLGITGTERTNLDLLDRITDQTTERMRLAIADNLNSPNRLAELNARLIQNGTHDPTDVTKLIPEYLAILQSFDDISAVLICNPNLDTMWVEKTANSGARVAIYQSGKNDGKCIEWNLNAKGEIIGEPIGSYPYDPQQRPWYIAAFKDKSERGWSTLYKWATTEEHIPIGTGRAMVVRDTAGELLAVVDIGFTVAELSHYLDGIEVSPNGTVFILDESGQLVATGIKDDPEAMKETITQATESMHPIVAHAAEVLQDSSLTRVDEAGFTHAAMTEHGDEQYMIVSSPLNLDWGPPWSIVIAIPEADLLAGVREVQARIFMWGIVVLVAAALGGLLLAVAIVRPIIGLRKSATAISNGDLNATFEGRGGREFAQLAEDLDAMCRGLAERLDLRNSLAVAMDVQQHLLPKGVPTLEHLDIAAFSTYCDETGGDYYDFPDAAEVSEANDGSLLVAIGDVTGHGIAAALIMASARAALRTRLRQGGLLGPILGDVNEVLAADTPDGRFMTFLALLIAPNGTSFRWTSAGHDPPLLYNAEQDTFHEPSGGGIPLGILADQEYEEYDCELGPRKSILVIGTDGIWETANPDKELYGKERLRDLIHRHREDTADQIGTAIIEELNAFRQSDRPLDDVTLIVIKRK